MALHAGLEPDAEGNGATCGDGGIGNAGILDKSTWDQEGHGVLGKGDGCYTGIISIVGVIWAKRDFHQSRVRCNGVVKYRKGAVALRQYVLTGGVGIGSDGAGNSFAGVGGGSRTELGDETGCGSIVYGG